MDHIYKYLRFHNLNLKKNTLKFCTVQMILFYKMNNVVKYLAFSIVITLIYTKLSDSIHGFSFRPPNIMCGLLLQNCMSLTKWRAFKKKLDSKHLKMNIFQLHTFNEFFLGKIYHCIGPVKRGNFGNRVKWICRHCYLHYVQLYWKRKKNTRGWCVQHYKYMFCEFAKV